MKQAFVCKSPSEVFRHGTYHDRHQSKLTERITAVWRHVTTSSGNLRLDVKTRHLTEFRRNIPDDQHPAGESTSWKSRMFIGKTGATGLALSSAITRFGTCPAQGLMNLNRIEHDPLTSTPSMGHTIQFYPHEQGSDPWFGVCCSPFTEQTVLDEKGQACLVRWFDRSHVGFQKGQPTTFYELTGAKQYQLLECMEDWGHLMEYDQTTELFTVAQDDTTTSGAGEDEGHPHNPDWYDSQVRTSEEELSGASPSREDLLAFGSVFRLQPLFFVETDGYTPRFPTSCGPPNNGPCVWDTTPYVRDFNKLPLVTPDGPVFLQPVRYTCKTHQKTVQAGARDDIATEPMGGLNINYYRLGDMRYSAVILPELQAAYVDTLTVAMVRRRILDRWCTGALAKLTHLKHHQKETGLRTHSLQRASRVVLALPDFVPSDESLTDLQLVLFQTLVLPYIEEYDAAVSAFDGQLQRIDGTFKCASVVMAHNPQPKNAKASGADSHGSRVFLKVGGCVLVVVGLEGLCLTSPRLVPSESNASISAVVGYVLRNRRNILGSLSAPSGFVTDCIRRHKTMLWRTVIEIYPELAADGEGLSDDRMLMLQDISHREWQFTRKIATPKTHGDYHDYVSGIKDVFHQLRVSTVTDTDEWTQSRVEWKNNRTSYYRDHFGNETISEKVLNDHLRTSLLQWDKSTKTSDTITLHALRELGNAGMCWILPEYTPRRLLIRTAKRLLMDPFEIERLFPDHGYETGEDFLLHLQGINRFYKEPRSLSRQYSTSTVVKRLGAHLPQARKGRARSHPRRSYNYIYIYAHIDYIHTRIYPR
jgi:hypothetical protein